MAFSVTAGTTIMRDEYVFMMLAICSDIDRWKDKKMAEEAKARYNEILYYGLDTEE